MNIVTCLTTETGDPRAIGHTRHTRAAIEESSSAIKRGSGGEDGLCRPRHPRGPRLLRVVEVEVWPEAGVATGIWRESGSVTNSDKRKFVFMSSKTINKVFDLSKS